MSSNKIYVLTDICVKKVYILTIIPFLTMIYWVLTLAVSPEGQGVLASTLAGQL